MEFLKFGVGWALAVVSLGASAYYFFYNKRKKSLEIHTRYTNLIATDTHEHDNLKVSYNDQHVIAPTIVTLKIQNNGSKDVASKDFDAELPLRIGLGAPVVSRLKSAGDSDGVDVSADGLHILVNPRKLASGETLALQLLVDGKPSVELEDNPLLDTKVVNVTATIASERTFISKVMRRLAWMALLILCPLMIFALYYSWFVGRGNSGQSMLERYSTTSPVTAALVTVVVVALAVLIAGCGFVLIRLWMMTSRLSRGLDR